MESHDRSMTKLKGGGWVSVWCSSVRMQNLFAIKCFVVAVAPFNDLRLCAATISGHVMLLWIGPGVWIRFSFGFSRTVESASDTQEHKVLYPPLNPISSHLISGKRTVTKTRQRFPTLPAASPGSLTLPYSIHVLVGEYYPHSLSRKQAKLAGAEHPCLRGSTNPGSSAVHMEPPPVRCSRYHFNIRYYHGDLS